MLAKFLRNVDSFNSGVPGAGNEMGNNIGGIEKAAPPLPPGAAAPAGVAQDALGIDYNGDGKGIGYAPPSLLGLNVLPPFYHNGACETLACVVNDPKHRGRAGNGQPRPDGLPEARQRQAVTEFLKSIDAKTQALP